LPEIALAGAEAVGAMYGMHPDPFPANDVPSLRIEGGRRATGGLLRLSLSWSKS